MYYTITKLEHDRHLSDFTAALAAIPEDEEVTIDFEISSPVAPRIAFALHALLVVRSNVTGILTGKGWLLGPGIAAFTGCQHRVISQDCEIVMSSIAYTNETGREKLKDWIDALPRTSPLFTADDYQLIVTTLTETVRRVRAMDRDQFTILRTSTGIPEEYYTRALTDSIEITPQQALEWRIATEIFTNVQEA